MSLAHLATAPDVVGTAAVTSAAQHAADLIGTFAFALSGALLAVHKGYDIVGIPVLACATAFGGGVIRDLIIAKGTPIAFVDQRYLWTSLLAAALVFLIEPPRALIGRPLDVADGVGLALFCVTGTSTAFHNGLGAVPSALLGVVTAVGGGVIRDLLARDRPSVLHPGKEIYAVPALFGASVTAVLLHFGWNTGAGDVLAVLGALAIRLLALRYHWHAPTARSKRIRWKRIHRPSGPADPDSQ